jgi:hypothetical protein
VSFLDERSLVIVDEPSLLTVVVVVVVQAALSNARVAQLIKRKCMYSSKARSPLSE